jgi:3-hydroxyacyl-[acyl-carrier-protein] dehydratase
MTNSDESGQEHRGEENKPSPILMDIEEIKKWLPHRYPFLLVDRILQLDPGKSAVGIKNVSANEHFFEGHFPDQSIMPGVLLIEAMSQLGGVMMLAVPEHRNKLAMIGGVDKARFRKKVVPGDTLYMFAQTQKVRGNMGWVHVHATVEGQIVTEAEVLFALQPR